MDRRPFSELGFKRLQVECKSMQFVQQGGELQENCSNFFAHWDGFSSAIPEFAKHINLLQGLKNKAAQKAGSSQRKSKEKVQILEIVELVADTGELVHPDPNKTCLFSTQVIYTWAVTRTWKLETSACKDMMFTYQQNLTYILDPSARNGETRRHVCDRLERWATKLLAYKYEIRHISGTDNVWAGLLTRWAKSSEKASSGYNSKTNEHDWRANQIGEYRWRANRSSD